MRTVKSVCHWTKRPLKGVCARTRVYAFLTPAHFTFAGLKHFNDNEGQIYKRCLFIFSYLDPWSDSIFSCALSILGKKQEKKK